MNKIIVAVFNSEADAYKGLDALKELHSLGDITLYSSAVLAKDFSGKVEIKQATDEGPVDTALGFLTGSLVGLIAGPAGVAYGATIGGMTGMLFDLDRAGVNTDFVDDVSATLLPGMSAVLAEIDEDWVAPVNIALGEFGGLVLRSSRVEIIEDQLDREATVLNAEMEDLQKELKKSTEKAKAGVRKNISDVQEKLKSVIHKAKAELDRLNANAKEKANVLKTQIKNVKDDRKAQIERRIEEIKADQKARSQKLQKAKKLASEALKQ